VLKAHVSTRQLSGLGLTSPTRRRQSEILDSTSMVTSACDATFREPSPFYAICAVSDVTSVRTPRRVPDARCRPRLVTVGLRQCCPGWLARLPVYYTTVCSRCSMLLHVPSPACDAGATSVTHSPVSTGWKSPSVFSTVNCCIWCCTRVLQSLLPFWWMKIYNYSMYENEQWRLMRSNCHVVIIQCGPQWYHRWIIDQHGGTLTIIV